MDAALYVQPKTWGDLQHFKERLDFLCTQDCAGPILSRQVTCPRTKHCRTMNSAVTELPTRPPDLTRTCTVGAEAISSQVVFMPGWSAFAESAEAAVGVQNLGLVWPGTEPKASQGLEKIGFKRI